MRRYLRTNLRFCLAIAAAAVLVRVAYSDRLYFLLMHIPSHDMSQGLAFFATSMHSMRLSGDIAWWNPTSITGYAQYFQGFFSPLAPTYGNVVFMAWAQLIAALHLVGIAVPEYFQYLAVNYLVLPFLAFAAFAYFCSRLVRHRAAILLALIAYVFSGIGLWNGAWFYFQEAFCLFFLLGATIAMLQRPRPAQMLWFLAAVLVQLAAVNYWTLYNVFFVVILLGGYGLAHRNQCRRLAARVHHLARTRPRATATALGVFTVVALAWTGLLAAAMTSQAGQYVRKVYTLESLPQGLETRRLTTELFNPSLERVATSYPVGGSVHNARYIGMALLPLLVVTVFAARGRRVRWLFGSAIGLLAVYIGFPPLLDAWTLIPFMDRIRHLFYMYAHHWEVVVVLMAAVGFDVFLDRSRDGGARPLHWIFGICAAASALGLVAVGVLSHHWGNGDPNVEAYTRAAGLLLITSVALLRAMRSRSAREVRFATLAVVWLLFIDLSAYFWSATRMDMAFTLGRAEWATAPPSAEQRAMLATSWGPPHPEHGFGAGLDRYMPIHNDFWPINVYLVASEIKLEDAVSLHRFVASQPPLLFYGSARVVPDQRSLPASLASNPAGIDRELVVQSAGNGNAGPGVAPRANGFSFEWRAWEYNAFELRIDAPEDGWIMVRQHYDPAWQVRIDGRPADAVKANYIAMALPVTRGSHTVRLDYEPLARRLYWFAAFLLEAALLAVVWTTRASRRAPREPASPAGTPGAQSRIAPH